MHRVLLATTGSLGDLHPMLMIGEALTALGARVTLASSEYYRDTCERRGFHFVPIGRAADHVTNIGYGKSMLGARGMVEVGERLNFDHLGELFAELLAAAERAEALVAPVHVVPAHLVAEKRQIPYITCAMSPAHIRLPGKFGEEGVRRVQTDARWHAALAELRRREGLSRRVLPYASILVDADCVLGLFPSFLMADERQRIANLHIVGYPQYRHEATIAPDQELVSFCDERTVVFSFGSYADACDSAYFFEESLQACRILNLKCLYLSRYVRRPSTARSGEQLLRAYAPHSEVFPFVGAVVHHGGTGTLMMACKYAKPMVIVPFLLDQPFHAARMHTLVGSGHVPAAQYDRFSAAAALQRVLQNKHAVKRELVTLMAAERDGAEAGARRILLEISRHRPRLFRSGSP